MRAVVPFDATAPKTRLAPVLDSTERRAFAERMLQDVVAAVEAAGGVPQVVATGPVDVDCPAATVRVDDRPLSAVVNDAIDRTLGDGEPLAVVVADLALATPAALSRLFEAEGDVVVAPGRGAGTNALVVRTSDFHVDYHGTSFLDHLDIARAAGTAPTVVDSFRLATDIDEPADLVEVLVHGTGRAHEWLDARFELAVDDDEGRVGLGRR
jgi:2-phospho-L-lactate guanylyltransferase